MIKEYIWGTEDWIYQDEKLLIKVIDAKKPLSVQVHPNDKYAQKAENQPNGKNEMWYILEADEGAFRIKLSLVCDDETADEDIYSAIMPALTEYNMGIVKVNI